MKRVVGSMLQPGSSSAATSDISFLIHLSPVILFSLETSNLEIQSNFSVNPSETIFSAAISAALCCKEAVA